MSNTENDMVICPNCDMSFEVIWDNNPVIDTKYCTIYDKIEYCPFCGKEL